MTQIGRWGAILMAGLLMATLLQGVVAAAPSEGHRLRPAERRFRSLANHERGERDRPRLRVNPRLTRMARRHSREMARSGSLHHRPDLTAGLDAFSWSVVGENVGVGGTVRSIHDAFMGSPPHRRNLLKRAFERMGVGVVHRDGKRWATFIFLG